MDKQIILERNLDFNQFKNVFILSFVCFFIFLVCIKYKEPTLITFFGLILLVLVGLMFLKKGLVIANRKMISTGYFLFGILLKINTIDATTMSSVSILSFGKHPNYNYTNRITIFSRWEPNLEYRAQTYQLYFLNETHKIKRKVLSLMNEESSNKAVEFIEQFTNFKFEIYNPRRE